MAATNQYTDYAVQNNILKSLEVLEDNARREWQQKWGFYLDFPKIIIDEVAKLGYTKDKYRGVTQRRRNKNTYYYTGEENLVPVEPTETVPTISSAFVGWRSDKKYSLEKFGPLYISPKLTLPYQARYHCIKLG